MSWILHKLTGPQLPSQALPLLTTQPRMVEAYLSRMQVLLSATRCLSTALPHRQEQEGVVQLLVRLII